MALTLGDNFSYQGAKPLDGRLKYDTVANMKVVADSTMYDGCIAYCVATDKTYQWKSTNTVDETLGKWREFSTGGGSSYTAGDGIDITNDVISTEKSQQGDMDEIVSDLPTGGAITVTGFTPIGTIISIFSETAPRNFLICDGSIYNKADYPELAYHLLHLTTHSQYEVDGDDTKFKVPDLRGEFLRGTGTNSHTNQGNGANVGVHQDATSINSITLGTNPVIPATAGEARSIIDYDTYHTIATNKYVINSSLDPSSDNVSQYRTVRPTNTSVLYCIAVRDIYTNPINDYSTSEKVVGTWVDGKPVYEKTLTGTLSNSGELLIPFDLTINKVVSLDGIVDGRVPINIRIDADVYIYAIGSLTSGGIYVKSGTPYYNCLVNIVVKYTKITD